jgi:hypothetical protein
LETLRVGDNLEDACAYGKIISELILKKQYESVWK